MTNMSPTGLRLFRPYPGKEDAGYVGEFGSMWKKTEKLIVRWLGDIYIYFIFFWLNDKDKNILHLNTT